MSARVCAGVVLLLAGLCAPNAPADQPPAARGEKESTMMIFDFRVGAAPWRSIDDVVMGGRSSSEMTVADGIAVFRGEVSLANNGGFASVRSTPQDHDLSGFDRLVLRVRGDGTRYQLRLRTTAAFDGVSYQAPLEPPAGMWQELSIPFTAFEPVFRGRRLSDHPPLDPAEVKSFGLMVKDGQAGPFRIEIEWIQGSRDRP